MLRGHRVFRHRSVVWGIPFVLAVISGAALAADRDLYVASRDTDSVKRYDARIRSG